MSNPITEHYIYSILTIISRWSIYMDKLLYAGKPARYIILLFFALMSACALSAPAFADDIILSIGTDSASYIAGENITVDGFAMSFPIFISYVNISIALIDSSGVTIEQNIEVTDDFGSFISILHAPYVAGIYDVTVTVIDTTATVPISITVPVSVVEIAEMRAELVGDSFVVSPFGAPEDYSITPDPSMEDVTAAVYNTGSDNYYMLLENVSGSYDRLYVSNDTNFTFSGDDGHYIEEGSVLKIGGGKYTVWYIDPKGNFVVFAKRIRHVFEPPYPETGLLVLALDSEGDPIYNAEIKMDVFDSEGNIEIFNFSVGHTDEYGILSTTLQLSPISGTHSIIFNDGLAYESYRIEIFNLIVSVVDESDNPVDKVSPGDTIFMKASVLGSEGILITDDVEKSEAKISGHGTLEKIVLSPDSDGVFRGEYIIPSSAKGKYQVQFKFMYDGKQEVRKIRIEVDNIDFSLYPISDGFGLSGSLAPGESSAMIISGSDTKNKHCINLYSMTDGCNASAINLEGIYDKDNVDVSDGEYQLFRLSDYVNYAAMPKDVRNRLKHDYGDKSCVMVFNAPDMGGIYRLAVSVSIDGDAKEVSSSIRVNNVFVSIVSPEGIVLPGERAYFAVSAQDALTGNNISAEAIVSASLLKVTARRTGDIVTESMIDVMINNSYSEHAALVSFIADDYIMGYHSVEFRLKINVTRNGTEKTVDAAGYGGFREQMYAAKAYLQEPDRIYAGTSDDVAIVIEVTSSLSVEGLTVSLDKLSSKRTGGKIKETSSCVTDSDGSCVILLECPKKSWNGGGYSAEFKIEGQDGMDEHVYGWFR